MMDVQTVITMEELVQHPATYLPARTIYCLKAFIDGVNCEDQTDVWDYLDGFYDWLLETFNHQSNIGMQCEIKLIMHYMSQDNHDAYDRFFELVQEFRMGEEEMPLFEALRERPYDFLPQKSIHCLYAYLWGKDMVAQGLIDPISMDEFEVFVQNHYDLESPWHKAILFHSQDEFGALNVFQELYDEFISQPSHATDSDGTPVGDYLPL
jgi:hypothetical protein